MPIPQLVVRWQRLAKRCKVIRTNVPRDLPCREIHVDRCESEVVGVRLDADSIVRLLREMRG